MDQTDAEAEQAVRDAIETLVTSGKRAYAHSVPLEAENLLRRRGKGRVSVAEASQRARAAIDSMVKRGVLEAPAEPWKDWLLK